MDCSPPGSSIHGSFLGKNTGAGCHFLLQGIFPTQGLNPRLLYLLHHHPHCILWIVPFPRAKGFHGVSLWPRVCQRTNRALFTSPPLWGPSRELRVRTAVKNQEQTSSLHCSLTRLWVRFRSTATRPSLSIRVSWYLCRPSRSDACPLLLFPHLSPTQDFYQTAESPPVSGGKGGSPCGLRGALYELPVCSFLCPFGSSPGGTFLPGSCSD